MATTPKGDPRVIELLNEVLTAELTAVNQYFGHARLQQHWGFGKLGEHTYQESVDEMRHADEVIKRVLYLDGMPNLQRLGSVRIGETVPEQFRLDLDVERDALDRFHRGIALCEEVGDHGTRDMLTGMLRSEEEHLDWLETQLSVIDAIGEQNYLAQQLGS
jgi:bacterioferritin